MARKIEPVSMYLLLEIAPLLFIDQDQIEVVSDREFLVDVSHSGRQVVSGKKDANRYTLPSDRRTVHNFIFRDRLILVEYVGTGTRRLPAYNCNLHVPDLDPHQQEIDFAHYDIF